MLLFCVGRPRLLKLVAQSQVSKPMMLCLFVWNKKKMTEFWAGFAGVSIAIPGQMTVSVFWNEIFSHLYDCCHRLLLFLL